MSCVVLSLHNREAPEPSAIIVKSGSPSRQYKASDCVPFLGSSQRLAVSDVGAIADTGIGPGHRGK